MQDEVWVWNPFEGRCLRMESVFGSDLIRESMTVVVSRCQLVLHCQLIPRCQILPCCEHLLAVKGRSLVVEQLLWDMILLRKFSCCEFSFLCRLWPLISLSHAPYYIERLMSWMASILDLDTLHCPSMCETIRICRVLALRRGLGGGWEAA